jgi:UDP-2,4-diacetamido-2,4,6-trideoxy-beta-L-altropyranose hydrolase
MPTPGLLIIFTEGDLVRGLGHVSRCSAYAEAWRARGGEVQWVLDGDAAARAMAGAAEVRALAWQGSVAEVLGELQPGLALVDSYTAKDGGLAEIADWAEATVFIDDLRRDYPRGLVVHAAPDRTTRRAEPSEAVWLEGPEWQPLRSAFWDLMQRPTARREIERILVVMGGGDLRGLGGVMARLAIEACPEARIDLVLAPGQPEPAHPHLTTHRGLDAASMAALMMQADVAISGAGQTIFELARCGVPTIMIGVADNQQPNLDHWPALCGFINAGRWDSPELTNRVGAGLDSLTDVRVRQAISDRGADVVDGQGVRRLFERLDQTRRA